MPWTIVENHGDCPSSRPFGVVKENDGELEGCHETRDAAQQQIAALEASENESSQNNMNGSTMKRRTKGIDLKIEDADEGKVSAVFSRFNVVDHDGDVTLPGAFPDGKEIPISAYGHESWMGALPVGKGVVRQTQTEAILDGQFFLDTTQGRDTFAVVKNLGSLQEWSYGFDVIEGEPGQFQGQDVMFLRKLEPHEASPVLKGAGIDTRTLDVKQQPNQDGHTMKSHALYVLAQVEGLKDRVNSLAEIRAKEGRSVSQANLNKLSDVAKTLNDAAKELNKFVNDHSTSQNSDDDTNTQEKLADLGGIEKSLELAEIEMSVFQ